MTLKSSSLLRIHFFVQIASWLVEIENLRRRTEKHLTIQIHSNFSVYTTMFIVRLKPTRYVRARRLSIFDRKSKI